MIDKKYIDRTISDLIEYFGIRSRIATGDFYESASHSSAKANMVILEHIGIRNPIEIVFVEGEKLMGLGDSIPGAFRPGRIFLPEAIKIERRADGSEREIGRMRMTSLARIEIDKKYRNDIRAMGAILSHEDTHLLLWLSEYAGGDPEYHEIETDIAGIVLGLGYLAANGRERYRGTGLFESMGYLDDESFEFINNSVLKIQRNNKCKTGGNIMQEIRCEKCGYNKNPAGEQFCLDCGAELKKEAADAKAAPVIQPVSSTRKNEISAQVSSGEVTAGASMVRLVVKRNGRVGAEFPIDQETVNIGRWDADSGSFAEIDMSKDDADNYVSRRHAKIFLKDGHYFIEDTGSVNGTYVNKGPRLIPGTPQMLQNGDEVIIARTFLQFIVE